MDRITQLKAFLAQNPADAFLQHALALEHIKAGDDTLARQLFEQLLDRDPAYVGSYYHLGKLLERNNEPQLAIAWYGKGMEQARLAKDQHALNELRMALEDLTD